MNCIALPFIKLLYLSFNYCFNRSSTDALRTSQEKDESLKVESENVSTQISKEKEIQENAPKVATLNQKALLEHSKSASVLLRIPRGAPKPRAKTQPVGGFGGGRGKDLRRSKSHGPGSCADPENIQNKLRRLLNGSKEKLSSSQSSPFSSPNKSCGRVGASLSGSSCEKGKSRDYVSGTGTFRAVPANVMGYKSLPDLCSTLDDVKSNIIRRPSYPLEHPLMNERLVFSSVVNDDNNNNAVKEVKLSEVKRYSRVQSKSGPPPIPPKRNANHKSLAHRPLPKLYHKQPPPPPPRLPPRKSFSSNNPTTSSSQVPHPSSIDCPSDNSELNKIYIVNKCNDKNGTPNKFHQNVDSFKELGSSVLRKSVATKTHKSTEMYESDSRQHRHVLRSKSDATHERLTPVPVALAPPDEQVNNSTITFN